MKRVLIFLCAIASLGASAGGITAFQDSKTELWGYKDAKGKVVIHPQYTMAFDEKPQGKLMAVMKDGRVSRIDEKGRVKFESVFFDNGADPYQEGLARFIEKNKVGFHNEAGAVVIAAKYDFAAPFEKGRSIVCEGCEAVYEHAPKCRPVSSSGGCQIMGGDVHLVVKGGKWGAIDQKGTLVIPMTLNSWDDVRSKIK